ncbi:MAG: YbhB/YbcL family Raf kinase inhibitor-like protein [Polyangiales bacterium]
MTASVAFGQGKERPTLELTSSEFKDGDPLPPSATCDGEAQSPALAWKAGEQSEGAKSYVLIVDDPDAPKGTFVHWLLFDIPKENISIPHGGSAGLTGTNSADQTGYFAACPPNGSGVHHYRFHLYALDTDRLGTMAGASRAQVETAMKGHVLQDALLTGHYERR